MKTLALVTLISAALVSSACVTPQSKSGNVYSVKDGNVGVMQQQSAGVVSQVRRVALDKSNMATSATGMIAGGVAGGLLGGMIGGGTGKKVARVAGAAGGAFAGDMAAKSLSTVDGLEIMVNLADGRSVTVVQEADVDIRPGMQVYVIHGNSGARVVARGS